MRVTKVSWQLTACFFAAFAMHAADGVTFVSHDQVTEALAKGGSLVKAPDLLVSGAHRTGPGAVELHDQETDVIYVTHGEATFVTGGVLEGGKIIKPGQHSGTSIQGGESHHLTKGDVIVVPAGVPHWFKEVPQSISYYIVKVLKP
jgi:mannose-6-phosphate isomerase-like protein (cupin superfamily)